MLPNLSILHACVKCLISSVFCVLKYIKTWTIYIYFLMVTTYHHKPRKTNKINFFRLNHFLGQVNLVLPYLNIFVQKGNSIIIIITIIISSIIIIITFVIVIVLFWIFFINIIIVVITITIVIIITINLLNIIFIIIFLLLLCYYLLLFRIDGKSIPWALVAMNQSVYKKDLRPSKQFEAVILLSQVLEAFLLYWRIASSPLLRITTSMSGPYRRLFSFYIRHRGVFFFYPR